MNNKNSFLSERASLGGIEKIPSVYVSSSLGITAKHPYNFEKDCCHCINWNLSAELPVLLKNNDQCPILVMDNQYYLNVSLTIVKPMNALFESVLSWKCVRHFLSRSKQ